MGPERVLASVFGSAGDLFPLMPTMAGWRAEGIDVALAGPRVLGLYARAVGVRASVVGDVGPAGVVADPRLLTTADSGWASFRRLLEAYVAPTLAADVIVAEELLGLRRPDMVLATSLSVAVRIAARRLGIPVVTTNMYPLHLRPGLDLAEHAPVLVETVAKVAGPAMVDELGVTEVAFGIELDHITLFDAALAPSRTFDGNRPPAGIPAWDALPTVPAAVSEAEAWLASDDAPVILATAGSFLGPGAGTFWTEVADAVTVTGTRAMFVGAPPDWAGDRPTPRIHRLPFAPLSTLLPRCDAVVHHGGLGTTVAAIRAGTPSVVVPIAFDQPYNAQLVHAAGVGIDGRVGPVHHHLHRLLSEDGWDERCRSLSARMTPPVAATEMVGHQALSIFTATTHEVTDAR